MENSALQNLEAEEQRLASSLRALCGHYGDEKLSKLGETSEILLSLGRVYVKKTGITHEMEQKINFIKAATLLHGARVRFNSFLNVEELPSTVFELISQLEKSLLASCNGKHAELISLSNETRSKLNTLRVEEKTELGELDVIPDDISEDAAHAMRVRKIEQIQGIMRKNTENFKVTMQGIALKCIEILGNQPCQFSIAGLGSLAREEMTLYSDFEHVILLEEGVQDRGDYFKIQEYFRWFAVLFHVIIIGIGETLIPSIGVKSLNNFYSSDKSANWFYDAYTPAGVSFDGMVPHACKIPLGRQERTENKPHTVELIQPISRMVKYLTSEEDLKNGYRLKDVLYHSCFVFGSKEIYDEFVLDAEATVVSDTKGGSLISLAGDAKRNPNMGVRGIHVLQASFSTVDSKSALYRPLATLMSYLARLNSIKKSSSFEKIEECFDRRFHFILKWAFAVACEVRLKLYAADSSNRKRFVGSEVLKYISKACLINCTSAITDLSRLLNKPWFQTTHSTELRRWPDSEPAALIFLHDTDGLMEVLGQQTYSDTQRTLDNFVDPINSTLALAFCFFREAMVPGTTDKKRNDLLQKAESTLDGTPMSLMVPRGRHILASIYTVQKRFKEALKMVESIFTELNLGEHSVSQDDIIHFRETQIEAARKCFNPHEMRKFCQDHLNLDFPSSVLFKYAFAREQFLQGEKEGGQEALKGILKELVSKGPKTISKVEIVKLMHQIFLLQFNEHLQEDCFITIELANEILESGPEIVNISLMAPQFVSYLAVVTYLYAAHSHAEWTVKRRIEIIEKAIGICKRAENTVLCEPLYCEAIEEIMSISDHFSKFNIFHFGEIYADAPDSVQCKIRTEMLAKLANYLIDCIRNYKVDTLQSLHGAAVVISIIDGIHPMVGPWMAYLYRKSAPLIRPIFSSLIWKDLAERSQLEGWDYGELEEASARSMVDLYWFEKFEPAVNTLWKLLMKKKNIRALILKLLDYVYGFLCLDSLVDLQNSMSEFSDFDSIPDSPFKLGYKTAVDRYMASYFECAHELWRVINLERTGSALQRKSVILLYWTIIELLRSEHGFQLKAIPSKRMITLRHPYAMDESAEGQKDDTEPLQLLKRMVEEVKAKIHVPRII